jgi:hypothetical protein
MSDSECQEAVFALLAARAMNVRFGSNLPSGYVDAGFALHCPGTRVPYLCFALAMISPDQWRMIYHQMFWIGGAS